MLCGQYRVHPLASPLHGTFLLLSVASADPYTQVSLVSFVHCLRGAGGGFVDYTTHYGTVRKEDSETLRKRLFGAGEQPPDPQALNEIAGKMGLRDLLGLPAVALSNG
jgi:hypothetical protein